MTLASANTARDSLKGNPASATTPRERLPRRWVVERTFSWLLRWRRLVRDYERLPETHEAFVKWAMVGLMLNRLSPPPGPRPWATNKRRE